LYLTAVQMRNGSGSVSIAFVNYSLSLGNRAVRLEVMQLTLETAVLAAQRES
jgi:hypothetical protein